MTELERQLTEALKRLSEQSGMERRRQSEQVEALRRQVEALLEHVERLSGENEVLQQRIERLDVLTTHLAEYLGTSTVARPRGVGI